MQSLLPFRRDIGLDDLVLLSPPPNRGDPSNPPKIGERVGHPRINSKKTDGLIQLIGFSQNLGKARPGMYAVKPLIVSNLQWSERSFDVGMEHALGGVEFPVIQALALRARLMCLRVIRGPFPRSQGPLEYLNRDSGPGLAVFARRQTIKQDYLISLNI